jgi:hypothetical protein
MLCYYRNQTDKLTHQDMVANFRCINYYDRVKNYLVKIQLLVFCCANKMTELVKFTLPENEKNIN